MNKQETETQKSETKKHAVNFLMAEYSKLNQEFQRLRGEGLNRLNFFIAITSSVLGGLVLLSQSGKTSGNFLQIVSLGALFFLVLIGWDTFRFTISRDINTDKNLRRIGRIRRFFADDFPPIAKHLPWQIHDEPTSWVTRNSSGIRQTAQSIISLLLALIIAILVSLITSQPIMLGIIGVISFIISFIALRFYANKRYKKAALSATKDRKFPNEK
ncbi:MAG TPA: hypothetical protein PKW76_15500 [bacterium]|nr:hypothetical protein [bacterium]HPG47081.1 hypothetical protein [bacterium]HPM99331.1 hypothetical protein [bacterium]